MAVESKRKKDESFESFLRRFNKRLQQSGNLYLARKIQYHEPKKSRNRQKVSALVAKKLRSKAEYLKKIGKFEEKPRGRRWK
jgi:ribosomal protein S21